MEIEVLKRQGLSLRRIAAEVGCAVSTVRSHLGEPGLPRYERKVKRVTKLAPFETYLRERQAAAHPNWIPASVLMREIVALGYQGGASQLRALLHGMKAVTPVGSVVFCELDKRIRHAAACSAVQALASGHDDVPRVERDGRLGRGCPQGGREQSVLVA